MREGASLSVIVMGADGHGRACAGRAMEFRKHQPRRPRGRARDRTWQARVTTYGPSSSSWTRLVRRDGHCLRQVGYVSWHALSRARSDQSWAHLTARLQGEAERSLADEAAGPLAQIMSRYRKTAATATKTTDPLSTLKAGIAAARGKAVLVETTAAGYGEGRGAAPVKDWKAERLGPAPPEALVSLSKAAFARMLAACGCSPALFDDSDGTSKRESAPAMAHGHGQAAWHGYWSTRSPCASKPRSDSASTAIRPRSGFAGHGLRQACRGRGHDAAPGAPDCDDF